MYKWRHWTLLVKPFRFHFPRKKELYEKKWNVILGICSWAGKTKKCENGLVKVKIYTYKSAQCYREKLKRGFILEICSTLLTKWWRPKFLPALVIPDMGVNFKIQTLVVSKVFFGRLTINLLVTKSEEFWSCGKKNQNMGWWPQSLGDKRKRQKRKWWLPGWFFFSPPCCCQQPGVEPSRLATAQKVKYFQCWFT